MLCHIAEQTAQLPGAGVSQWSFANVVIVFDVIPILTPRFRLCGVKSYSIVNSNRSANG